MKPLILNTFDTSSGSALAALRLNQGLQSLGIDSQMLVFKKTSPNPAVLGLQTRWGNTIAKGSRALDPALLKLYQKFQPQISGEEFSVPWVPDWTGQRIAALKPDLLNLHWVNYGFLQIESLARLNKPLVWTLHDMWAFTGGCHYNQECDRYRQSCGACPQLHSQREADLSRWIWQRKAQSWQGINLTVVTPSAWLAARAAESSLFRDRRIEVIPNGIDTTQYQPLDRAMARAKLNLPQDKRLILFGAINPTSASRKGFQLLQPALQSLRQMGWQDHADLVIFGTDSSALELGFQTHYLGKLNGDLALALAYSAADICVVPSVQENLPNTLVEAIACGTPCVAFNVGGNSEIIDHQQNGYLAQAYEVEDLAAGIAWVLASERYQHLCEQARQKAQAFTLEVQAQRYLHRFEEVVQPPPLP